MPTSPPLVIPAGFGQATFKFLCSGNTHVQFSSLGFAKASGYSMTGFKTAVESAFCGTGAPFAAAAMCSLYSLKEVDYLFNNAGILEAGQTVFNRAGSVIQSPVPINCSEIVKKTTALAGRPNRGRMFLPPMHIDESSVDQNGSMGSVTAGVLTTIFTTAYNSAVTSGYLPYILHHSALAPTAITSLSVEVLLGTQRRRMRK